jgi:uncharacterized C2H2 Zn-finger protein
MAYVSCPYCDTINKDRNIIDVGHSSLKNMSRKGNTKNIYLCPECGEVFEGNKKLGDFVEPVDMYFNRAYLGLSI